MIVANNQNYNKSTPAFGAKLGWRAAHELKKTPAKLEEISKKLKTMGEPTTIVDIMSQDTKNGKIYSLRLFNEIFGDKYNISLLKDNRNNDIIASSAKAFISNLENITKNTVESKEYNIFNKIRNEHSGSYPLIKYLKGIICQGKEHGKYLSPKTEQTFFKEFS